MAALLVALDSMSERGMTDRFLPPADLAELARGRTRLSRALYLQELAALGEDWASDEGIARTASVLDPMSHADRRSAYRYLMARRQVPRDVEDLIEGFLALEDAAVEWREPVVAAGVSVGGELPPPVEPGPWNKPPGEPAELYIGQQAHEVIAKYYADAHRGETVQMNHTPISTLLTELQALGHAPSAARLSAAERDLRPDILNLSRLYIYEIKPTSLAASAAPRAAMYIGVLRKAGVIVSLGPSAHAGTSGRLPAEWRRLRGVAIHGRAGMPATRRRQRSRLWRAKSSPRSSRYVSIGTQ